MDGHGYVERDCRHARRAFILPDAWKIVRLVLIRPKGWVHANVFSEVLESLAHGFRSLGVRADIAENEVLAEAVNIFLMPHYLPEHAANTLPSNSIIYNFEQVADKADILTPAFRAAIKRHRVWDYSHRNMTILERRLEHQRRQVVPVGYAPVLSRIPRATKQDIDVLFYGSVNERRQKILLGLREAGLAVAAPFGLYGAERDALIARSKVLVNIHSSPSKIIEMVRISYLLANRKAVVTELDDETEAPLDIRDSVVGAPYDGLIDACKRLVADADARQDLEDRGYAAFQKHDMTAILRRAITESAQIS
jgi:hypothetical protein